MNESWKLKEITATGVAFPHPIDFGGAFLAVAGTSTTITAYNHAASATGSPVVPTTAALTVGQFVPPAGGLALNVVPPANGIRCDAGLYVTVGGTGSPKIYILWR